MVHNAACGNPGCGIRVEPADCRSRHL